LNTPRELNTQLKIALTGANGRIGRVARRQLSARGYDLRATDRSHGPEQEQAGDGLLTGDLIEPAFVDQLLAGIDVVVHMAGTSNEQAFALINDNNHRALQELYEGARRHGVRRIVYASSNHAFGLHPVSELLRLDAPYRPDCFYGLSKVWGEALGLMYWQKHGIETVALRIGTFMDCAPRNARELCTWIGSEDLAQLIGCAVEATDVGFAPVWGISANTRAYYDLSEPNVIGYAPRQNAEDFAAEVLARPAAAADPVAEFYQGGRFVTQAYTPEAKRPARIAPHRP
jgi:uronate dehydrogenase